MINSFEEKSVSFGSSMLEEVHGDTCRLGYLKLVSCLADDFQPYSEEYFSSRLYSLTKDHYKHWSFPSKLSNTGLITEKQGLTISRNYVNLSYEFGILNKRHQTLGPFGRIYSKTNVANGIRQYIQDRSSRLENVVILNDLERILFLKQLLTKDGLAIGNLLKLIFDLSHNGQENVSRKKVMDKFMEENYYRTRVILSEATKNYSKKLRLKEDAEKAKMYKEERLKLQKAGKWGNSQLYAKYRHTVPPRIEWLIDLGILEKRGRGIYKYAPIGVRLYELVSTNTPESFNDKAFHELGNIYMKISSEASNEEIKSLLVDCFGRFEKAGHLAVDKTLLENLVAYQALEILKKGARLSVIDKVIDGLHESYPELVRYHVDLSGKWRFVKISKNLINRSTS